MWPLLSSPLTRNLCLTTKSSTIIDSKKERKVFFIRSSAVYLFFPYNFRVTRPYIWTWLIFETYAHGIILLNTELSNPVKNENRLRQIVQSSSKKEKQKTKRTYWKWISFWYTVWITIHTPALDFNRLVNYWFTFFSNMNHSFWGIHFVHLICPNIQLNRATVKPFTLFTLHKISKKNVVYF